MPTSTRGRDPAVEEEFLGALYKGGELLASGKIVEAREHLEKAHGLEPKNEKAQNLLGLTYFKLGLFDRASEVYEKLVNENPTDATLRVNLGLVYLKTNNLERCIKEFETATDLEPTHKKAHNYLGLALAQQGTYAKAKEHFELAGSDQMAEKMARALASTSSPSGTHAPVARQQPKTVVLGSEEEAAKPPPPPAPPPLPTAPAEEEAIEVMSDEELPSDVYVVPDEEPPARPAPSAPGIHSDWGAQLKAPAPPADAGEMRFAEDEGPPEQQLLEAPPVPMEELPVLEAEVVPSSPSAPAWLTMEAAQAPKEAPPPSEGWVTETVAEVPPPLPPERGPVTWTETPLPMAAPIDAAPADAEGAAPADDSSWATVPASEPLPSVDANDAHWAGEQVAVQDDAAWATEPASEATQADAWATAPAAEPTQVEASWATTPAAEPTQADASWANAPAAEPTQADASWATTPAAEPTQGDASWANAPAAEPTQADASWATAPAADATQADASWATAPAAEPTQADAAWATAPAAEPTQADASWATAPAAEPTQADAAWATAPTAEPTQADAAWATEPAAEPTQAAPSWATAPAAEPTRADASWAPAAESTQADAAWATAPAEEPTVADDASWATGPAAESPPADDASWATGPDAATPAEATSAAALQADDASWATAQPPADDSWGTQVAVTEEPPAPEPSAPLPITVEEPVDAPIAAPPAGYAPMSPQRLVDLGASGAWVQEPTAGPFHISADGLAVTVAGEMLLRMAGLVAVVGSLDVKPEHRRRRGRPTAEPFGAGANQLQRVAGNGMVYLEAGRSKFHAVDLTDQNGVAIDDDGAYIREEFVFAFEEPIFFENGKLTNEGQSLELAHLKGTGRVLLQLDGALKAMPIPLGAPLVVPLQRVVGWFGRVSPRLMGFGGRGAIELTGEGYALLGTPAERA